MLNPSKQSKILPIKNLAFVLGFTSIISQVILLRELVAVFYGNETAYAIILASWLFWIAVGSGVVSFLSKKILNAASLITVMLFSISILLPATIVATRCVKVWMNIPVGEIIGIMQMCMASFLLLAPLTLLLGGLFTSICHAKYKRQDTTGPSEHIRLIYLWESKGAAIGGAIFSFILVTLLPAMPVAFLVALINCVAIYFFCSTVPEPRRFGIPNLRGSVLVICLLAILLVFPLGLVKKLDQFSRRLQWQGVNLVTTTDSIYGNIALTEHGGKYSLYENGLLSYTTGDDLTSEESVHYPLLAHPHPHDILLIGGGVTGGVGEILKHPGTHVDYVELDPKVFDIARQYFPREYVSPLEDARVNVIHADARAFVKRSVQKYDVVIVNLSDPYTALLNRYYSLEFFEEVRRSLNSDGILSLGVSSSENYLNEETRTFLRSINTTLRRVFPDVQSIPGETNIFLAGVNDVTLALDSKIFVERLKKRQIKTQFVREYYLPFRLSPDRMKYIEEVLKAEGQVNTDMHPVAYLYDIILWSTHFNTTFQKVMAKVQQVPFFCLLFLPGIVFFAGWLRQRKSSTAPISLSIATTGFSEIIFQVIVIIAFQTLYGYAYYKIGLIVSAFMLGLVLGSLVAGQILRKSRNVFRIYKTAQLGITVYPLLLPVVFIVFRDAVIAPNLTSVFATTFALLPVIAGFLGGLQYPLATHLTATHTPEVCVGSKVNNTAQAAGFLYAFDVLGAAIGALVTGAILIPLYGITVVAILCAVLNMAVFVLLTLTPMPRLEAEN